MEVRKIAPGEIITEPGFYDMPITWYHDNCCDGPSTSSSGLRTLALETPLHYWDTSYLNPNRDPDAGSEIEADHFRLGRAAHWLMLEPHLYAKNIAVRPGLWDSWRSKDAKAWRDDALKAGFTVLTAEEELRAKGAAAALKAHPLHEQGLLSGAVELSMVIRDKKTGIWLKSRPDAIPLDDALTDLKFVASAKPEDVEKSIRNLGYDMQMALGGIAYQKLTGQPIETYWVVATESKRPHAIHIAPISQMGIYWARIRLRDAVDKMAACLQSGYWPAYEADGKEAGPTKWEIERFTELQKNALLPDNDEFTEGYPDDQTSTD